MTKVRPGIAHEWALAHTTGRSVFLDDLAPLAGELVLALVGSPVPKGTLRAIEMTGESRRAGAPGIFMFTAADIPGQVHFGAIESDEAFLAVDRVSYVGQPVAVIAAETTEALASSDSLVHLEIDEEEPVLTLDDALDRGEFFEGEKEIEFGDVTRAWERADHRLEGVLSTGGQEHCYLEPQAAWAEPDPSGGVRVRSSTQNPTEIQSVTAAMLGLGMHQVVVEASTMGGAFGGKETQAAVPALACALVAHLARRPARLVLPRQIDMSLTGKRHDYKILWSVGFDTDGSIQALDLQFYSNGGSALDLSPAVLERTLLHATNAYYIPNVRLRGKICRTNLPPNTAFRGFGAPQAVAAMEHVIEAIAVELHLDALQIRTLNCYRESSDPVATRSVTPYGQRLHNTVLPELLRESANRADYAARLRAIEEFNRTSQTHYRGISLLPVNFGISFTTLGLNQANALINLYSDGTIQVSTGATEMGQGSNTKIRQLVAAQFGVAMEHVRVMRTSTEKNHNTAPTAASVSTDLNGLAALNAAQEVMSRLRTFTATLLGKGSEEIDPATIQFNNDRVSVRGQPERGMPFAELARAANVARIDLGARGFFATPGIGFDWTRGRGHPFRYFTAGSAVTEVVIERSTGIVEVARVDILMETGASINPDIDRGQVCGGFVQGMGWVLSEELSYDHGRLTSNCFSTYKIPTIQDVPDIFNVAVIDHSDPARLVGGKGVGEPPLVLGLSVWTAIKHALSCIQPGTQTSLDLPATPERVLLALEQLQTRPFGGSAT